MDGIKLNFVYNDQQIPFTLIEASRRTMSLKLDPIKGIIVRVPKRQSPAWVMKMLEPHGNWLVTRYHKFENIQQRIRTIDGSILSHVPILGHSVTVEQSSTGIKRIKVVVNHDNVTMQSPPDIDHVKLVTAMKKALKAYATSWLSSRFMELGGLPDNVIIREFKARWGSTMENGTIQLNWRLIFCQGDMIDYVIYHELAHLREMNHSSNFWRLVAASYPQYKVAKRWFKEEGQAYLFILR